MNFPSKRQAVYAGSLVLALSMGGALAADLGGVTVVPDKDVNARTHMPRSPSDTSQLGVTYDQDVAKRTNMQREPGNAGQVKVIQDKAVMERTNMGDTARSKPASTASSPEQPNPTR